MPLDNSTARSGYYTRLNYDDVRTRTFGIQSSLNGVLPSYRIVYLNSEPKDTNGETNTDNVTVGYVGTLGATTVCMGITKFGQEGLDNQVTYLPGFNKDLNVSVTYIGDMLIEVVPGETISVGTELGSDAEGRANGSGGTGIIAVSATSGTGTADNPEYVRGLIR